MARIRTVKPEFWTDSKTGTLRPETQVVFIGLWNLSDDYGVLENDPIEIVARILPHRKGSVEQTLLEPLLEIFTKGLIEAFQFEEKPYIFIKKFTKHQRINRPSNPLLPDFDKHPTPARYLKAHGVLSDPSVSTHRVGSESLSPHGVLTEHSLRKGKEGKGVEWNGAEAEWNGTDRKGGERTADSVPADAPTPPATGKTTRAPREFLSSAEHEARRIRQKQLADQILRAEAPAPTPEPEPEDFHDQEPEPDWDDDESNLDATGDLNS